MTVERCYAANANSGNNVMGYSGNSGFEVNGSSGRVSYCVVVVIGISFISYEG